MKDSKIPPLPPDKPWKDFEKTQNPACLTLGKILVGACVSFLVIGRVVANMFFSEAQGKGLNDTVLMILIPVWTMGIVGLVLLCIGWIQKKIT